jgi:hypothetical protein
MVFQGTGLERLPKCNAGSDLIPGNTYLYIRVYYQAFHNLQILTLYWNFTLY